jgi:hypothetical protein
MLNGTRSSLNAHQEGAMKNKLTAISLVAAVALVLASASPASARPAHYHGHGGRGGDGLLFGLLGGLAVAGLATAALAEPAPVYYRTPTYYAPPPVYAYPRAVYPSYAYGYRHPRTVVYGYPTAVYGYR